MAVQTACCASCAVPELGAFSGVNADKVDAFRAVACAEPMACPKCATRNNPNVAARCESGHCKAFDVRERTDLSGCKESSDCQLRNGLDCCECNSSQSWVAINTKSPSTIVKDTCAPATACDECLPLPPPGTQAACVEHVCQVTMEGGACALPPRDGCCFADTDCAGLRCYGVTCSAGSEGACKPAGSAAKCWGDRDCSVGQSCKGAGICPCGAACLVADRPGSCG